MVADMTGQSSRPHSITGDRDGAPPWIRKIMQRFESHGWQGEYVSYLKGAVLIIFLV